MLGAFWSQPFHGGAFKKFRLPVAVGSRPPAPLLPRLVDDRGGTFCRLSRYPWKCPCGAVSLSCPGFEIMREILVGLLAET